MSSGWDDPWARHYQSAWEERSGDPRLPLWLRVTALAYGSHKANGHAMFAMGDVRLAMSKPDGQGVPVPPDQSDITRAIRKAVEYEWLAPGSGARCLVVPGHAVTGGRAGSPDAPCPQHLKRGTKAA